MELPRHQMKSKPVWPLAMVVFSVGVFWTMQSLLMPVAAAEPQVAAPTSLRINQLEQPVAFSALSMKLHVEQSLGLGIATIYTKLEHPPAGTIAIPWRSNLQPVIMVAVPQSWVSKRAVQQGSQFIVLDELRAKTELIVPGARVELNIIQDPVLLATTPPSSASYGKHIVVLVGLIAIFCTTGVVSRRKVQTELHRFNPLHNAQQEAASILLMDYAQARRSIDALHGERRLEVLRLIAATEPEELPVVEVSLSNDSAPLQTV